MFICYQTLFLCCRNWKQKKNGDAAWRLPQLNQSWHGREKKKRIKKKTKHAHCACLGDRVFEISKCTTSLQAHSEQKKRKRSDGTETTSRKRNVLLQGNWSSCGHFHGYKRGFWPNKQEICFTVSDAEIIFITAKQSKAGGGREARKRGATEEKKKITELFKMVLIVFCIFRHSCVSPSPAPHLQPGCTPSPSPPP